MRVPAPRHLLRTHRGHDELVHGLLLRRASKIPLPPSCSVKPNRAEGDNTEEAKDIAGATESEMRAISVDASGVGMSSSTWVGLSVQTLKR